MNNHATLDAPSLAPHNTGVPHRAGLRQALRATRPALQWRLLLWWALLLLLPTAVAALPLWQMLSANFDHSLYAAHLAERLDMLAFADLLSSFREHYATAVGGGATVALVLTLLLSPLLGGMTIAAARSPVRLGFLALPAGGAREYGRLLRMLVWAVVPLGIAGAVGGAFVKMAGHAAEAAILESDAVHAAHLATAGMAILLLLAHATVDAGRAVLAADPRRKSAVLAWWAGVKLLVRRPLAVLGAYLAVTLAGLAVAAALALARMHVPALGAFGTPAAFVLMQLAVIALGWMRSARLFALLELAR